MDAPAIIIKTNQGAYLVHIACSLLTLAILFTDLQIPLGVAISVLYVVVVFLTMWQKDVRLTVIFSIICVLCVFAAYVFKPEVEEMWKVYANRLLAIIAIMSTAFLCIKFKNEYYLRVKAVEEKNYALNKVKILSGLLPICASCKKIRDDAGYWVSIEKYITEHSEADFTHGICPECRNRLYPEVAKKLKP